MTDDSQVLRASYHTLGCKLNFSETSAIGVQLSKRGIIKAQADETPDIVVVNTCSVTEVADKKGRSLIRRLRSRWPDATLVVTGCYAQLKPQEVASIDGVDMVLGNDEKLNIAEYLEQWEQDRRSRVAVHDYLDIRDFRGACERGDRTRYWLKVQDGCDYFCTYCTIPFARGRSRSGNIEELVREAEKAASEGGKEIVLTGVNVGCFGKDTGQDFLELLKRLDDVAGIERYRISSIEPNLLTEKIIQWIAESSRAFMPSFHIPLQSGSDEVLKLMNRRYNTGLFTDRINMIRSVLPDAFIGVDIIAGARGETEEEWENSFRYAESLPVSRYHVFPYSERPGTKALGIDHQVSQEDKHR
ncbi:MAG: tRNA (N(6)-L-threonylcarbamoyladenosine(37)-C(2))-methylthiotransferase MtaB, partial [Muribaculaceae bacterium]|nr:tRNA (N(6)-L-threonylcarbamoyladenosine(37)-C(2))-methylthiotransferase MtaB [Muribaculaceae bacterium]